MKKIIIILLFLFIPINVKADFKSVLDVTNTNVIEIQDYIDKGYLTYETLIQIYLDRINLIDEDYNTIRIINENAIKQAKQMDLELKTTGRRSMVHGIPIIIKDNIDVKGFPTTGGSRALLDSYPKKNATIVQKLLDNGAIIIAKSNMSEFAFSARNSYSSFGHVKNAFDSKYTPYGSSGGSASAIALNFAVMALGTDTNSSVRLPASGNNVVGIRPTYDSLLTKGIITYDKERDVVGPITDNVIDNAIFLSIINDKNYYDEEDTEIDGIKIGFLHDFVESKTSYITALSQYDQDIANLTYSSKSKLEELGFEVVLIKDFYTSKQDNINNKTIFGRIFCYDFNEYIVNTESKIKNYNDLLATKAFVQNLYEYNISCNTDLRKTQLDEINAYKQEYKNYVKETMDKSDVDLLMYPSVKSKTFMLSDSNPILTNITHLIAPSTGYPAINIPMGFIDQLPYGIEFLTLPNNEELLYKVSSVYEKNTNHNKIPVNSLYDTDKINDLIKIYEENQILSDIYTKESYDDYINVNNEIKSYILNYSNEEEKEEQLASKLLTAVNNLEEKPIINSYYLILLLIIVLSIILKLINSKNKKKK